MKKAVITLALFTMMAPAAYAANALPTVATFTVPASSVSPVPVTAFTATDTDGTVVGYMITESSTKPAATATGWSTPRPVSYATTKTGAVTLYAWAKDNAGGVSAAKTASVTLLGSHTHYQSDVVGLTAALAAKADVSALATKADATTLSNYQAKYANVIVVAKSGGDFTDPVSAINSITSASESNQYLIKIMPGVYIIPGLTMKEFVDIEGSGQNTTKLASQDLAAVTVGGASNSEIRDLTLENNSDVYGGATVVVNTSASQKLTNVTLNSICNFNSCTGILNIGGNPVLTNVSLKIAGRITWGMYNMNNSLPVVNGMNFHVRGVDESVGIFNYDSSASVNNVVMDVYAPQNCVAVWTYAYLNDTFSRVTNSTINISGSCGGVTTFSQVHKVSASVFNTIIDYKDASTPVSSGVKCVNVVNGSLDPISCL